MRISTRSSFRSSLLAIQTASQRLAELQTHLAEGRRIQKPSDGPLQAATSLAARHQVRSIEASLRGIDRSRSYLEAQESILGSMNEVFTDLESLAHRGADDGLGGASRKALALEVDAYIEELVEMTNQTFGGVHVFSGTDSKTPSLAVERDAEGRIVSVNPSASPDAPRSFYLGDGAGLRLGVTAADAWGDQADVMQDMLALRDRLLADDGEGVRGLLETMEAHGDRLRAQQSVVGVQVNHLEKLEAHFLSTQVEAEATRSKAEDLDMAAAAIRWNQETAGLEATLTATSRLLNLNLLDFLR